MLTRLPILVTLVAVLSQVSQAQLSKSQQSAVVHLKSPGKCSGTGFFVSAHYILTASHVAKTVRLEVMIDGKRHYCTVSKRNETLDWALLYISSYACQNPLKTANPAQETQVYGYGYPGKREDLHSSQGIASIDAVIGAWQYNGEAKMGMSGGPVVNQRGQAVGIITSMGRWGCTVFRSSSEVDY